MYERNRNTDASYAERAIAWEAGYGPCCEPREEIVIPMHWIAAWLGTMCVLSVGIRALISWLA